MNKQQTKVTKFFDRIGLPYQLTDRVNLDGFLSDDCTIKDGILVFNNHVETEVLIHEAAHIATTPKKYRDRLSGDVATDKIFSESDFTDPLVADSFAYVNDLSAIGWSYFALELLGLDTEKILATGLGKDTVTALQIGLISPCGSAYSTALYYLGMLATKQGNVIKWMNE